MSQESKMDSNIFYDIFPGISPHIEPLNLNTVSNDGTDGQHEFSNQCLLISILDYLRYYLQIEEDYLQNISTFRIFLKTMNIINNDKRWNKKEEFNITSNAQTQIIKEISVLFNLNIKIQYINKRNNTKWIGNTTHEFNPGGKNPVNIVAYGRHFALRIMHNMNIVKYKSQVHKYPLISEYKPKKFNDKKGKYEDVSEDEINNIQLQNLLHEIENCSNEIKSYDLIIKKIKDQIIINNNIKEEIEKSNKMTTLEKKEFIADYVKEEQTRNDEIQIYASNKAKTTTIRDNFYKMLLELLPGTCEICTFKNKRDATTCEMCNNKLKKELKNKYLKYKMKYLQLKNK